MALGRKAKVEVVEKVLDVNASMQGTLTFKDPVNLKINGNFEGNLNIKGRLMIGENAKVRADITGEEIVIAGAVNGNIVASRELKLISPGCVIGNVTTPTLSVAEGAILEGFCKMMLKERKGVTLTQKTMTIDELSNYLEVDKSLISEWADKGKLPAVKDGDAWRFDRSKVDEWVAAEKIK